MATYEKGDLPDEVLPLGILHSAVVTDRVALVIFSEQFNLFSEEEQQHYE